MGHVGDVGHEVCTQIAGSYFRMSKIVEYV